MCRAIGTIQRERLDGTASCSLVYSWSCGYDVSEGNPYLIAAAILGMFCLCISLPLATYSLSLAIFGLAHVGSELNYVGARFERKYWVIFLGICLILLIGFTMDFKLARSIYGISAAVHAWIEIPILLLALATFTNRREMRSGLNAPQPH